MVEVIPTRGGKLFIGVVTDHNLVSHAFYITDLPAYQSRQRKTRGEIDG